MNNNSEILTRWKQQIGQQTTGFVFDGAIVPELYHQAPTRICFLCKEANYQKPDDVHAKDWYQEGGFKQFSTRLQEWAAGIALEFPPIESLTEQQKTDALRTCAIVNVKKIGGKGNASDWIIAEHAREHNDLLKEQLAELNPNILILGVSTRETRTASFPDLVWLTSGYQCDIAKWNNTKLIDFYHPSSRNAPAAAYSLLQNIIHSKPFLEL